MFVMVLSSAKGGVGRTTLAANLAGILCERGFPVTLVEADPQQALPAHFGLPAGTDGWAARWLAGESPAAARVNLRPQLDMLPFGVLPADRQAALLAALAERPAMPDLLAVLADRPDGLVLVDAPAGNHPLACDALAVADGVLSLWLCDSASLNAWQASGDDVSRGLPVSALRTHVVNQINATRNVRRELFRLWRDRLGTMMLPVPVHQDEAVSDALQQGSTVVQLTQHSQAAHDMHGIADWLLQHWLRKRGTG